jgi:hypothetical protein
VAMVILRYSIANALTHRRMLNQIQVRSIVTSRRQTNGNIFTRGIAVTGMVQCRLDIKGILLMRRFTLYTKSKSGPTAVCRFCVSFKDAKMSNYGGDDGTDFDKCLNTDRQSTKTNHISGKVTVSHPYCKSLNGNGQCQDFIGRTEFIWNLETV